MSNPLVTFVICAYNQERYICDAVNGALAQDYSPLEIILSDDCSSDNTFSIIKQIAAEYKGIHKIILNRNTSNFGLGKHLQTIFEMAAGEWIVLAAGDDISLPNRSSTLIKAATKDPNIKGVASSWVDIDENGFPLKQPSAPTIWHNEQISKVWPTGLEGIYETLVNGRYLLPGCAAMWNRSLIIGWPSFTNGLAFEDVTLSCRIHLTGKMTIIGDQLLKYRQHDRALVNLSGDHISLRHKVSLNRKKIERNYLRLMCYRQAFRDIEMLLEKHAIDMSDKDLLIVEKIRQTESHEHTLYNWWKKSVPARLCAYLKHDSSYPFPKHRLMDALKVLPWEWNEYCRALIKSN